MCDGGWGVQEGVVWGGTREDWGDVDDWVVNQLAVMHTKVRWCAWQWHSFVSCISCTQTLSPQTRFSSDLKKLKEQFLIYADCYAAVVPHLCVPKSPVFGLFSHEKWTWDAVINYLCMWYAHECKTGT